MSGGKRGLSRCKKGEGIKQGRKKRETTSNKTNERKHEHLEPSHSRRRTWVRSGFGPKKKPPVCFNTQKKRKVNRNGNFPID